jgi:hypothetical protein
VKGGVCGVKKKALSKAVKEQNKRVADTWAAVQDAVTAVYGCLVPQGEITVQVVLSWAKEEMLGVLKRSGKIISWAQDKEYEDGNNRRYIVTLDTAKI